MALFFQLLGLFGCNKRRGRLPALFNIDAGIQHLDLVASIHLLPRSSTGGRITLRIQVEPSVASTKASLLSMSNNLGVVVAAAHHIEPFVVGPISLLRVRLRIGHFLVRVPSAAVIEEAAHGFGPSA